MNARALRETAARLCMLMGAVFLSFDASAIILFSTGDPEANTTAPAGTLAGSGWQHQGHWGNFTGTAIAPQFFLAAKHVGGNVGGVFSFDGTDYVTVSSFADPESDLQLWRVAGRFPSHAAIYDGTSELRKPIVLFGRGTQRGGELVVDGLFGPALKGWLWGPSDNRLRWGENRVESIVESGSGGSASGALLRCTFDADGGLNEAHLSGGDSSGGAFIDNGGGWKLAGIAHAVDGPYNTSGSGPGFSAAVFDEGGLYKGAEGNWQPVIDAPGDTPGGFYLVRVSVRRAWIESIIAQFPDVGGPQLQSSLTVAGIFTDEPNTIVDAAAKTISAPLPTGTRFFRLRGDVVLRITSIRRQENRLVFGYE